LAGQSNAVGCSYVEYLSGVFPKEKISKWRNGYEKIKINYFSHDIKSGGFVKTSFNCSVSDEDTFGPEVGIADLLDEKYPAKEFFIVKCAFGGVTLMRDFLSPSGSGGYDPLAYADQKENINDFCKPGEPVRAGWAYNELVKILSDSLSELESLGCAPEIKALCWMQGESDANSEEATRNYERNYGAFVSDIKTAFSPFMKDCLFVDAGISKVWERYERMNEIKRRFAADHPGCVFIDTIAAGLDTMKEPHNEPDIGHYDAESMIKLGRTFAKYITNIK
jgi:hypothetical protein